MSGRQEGDYEETYFNTDQGPAVVDPQWPSGHHEVSYQEPAWAQGEDLPIWVQKEDLASSEVLPVCGERLYHEEGS